MTGRDGGYILETNIERQRKKSPGIVWGIFEIRETFNLYLMKLQKWSPWLVFIAAMLWATDAPFRVHLTKEVSSSFIVLAEHFIDVLFILPVLWWKRKEIKSLGNKERLAVIVIAVGSSALASVAFTKAFAYVNPSV